MVDDFESFPRIWNLNQLESDGCIRSQHHLTFLGFLHQSSSVIHILDLYQTKKELDHSYFGNQYKMFRLILDYGFYQLDRY